MSPNSVCAQLRGNWKDAKPGPTDALRGHAPVVRQKFDARQQAEERVAIVVKRASRIIAAPGGIKPCLPPNVGTGLRTKIVGMAGGNAQRIREPIASSELDLSSTEPVFCDFCQVLPKYIVRVTN